jgi:hypothetical protein
MEEHVMMMTQPPDACNVDRLIQVAPYALVYVFQTTLGLCVTSLHWSSRCTAKTILAVAVYVAGLTALERKQTQSRMARLLGHVSHDALNRLANDLTPLYNQMVIGLLLVLESLKPGYLILDDVLLPKPFAKLIAGVYPAYDSAQKRHVMGQRVVVLLWTNGVICVPVAFVYWHHRLFVRRYRTKNTLARILVYWAVRHHMPCRYLTFDNWYASKQNLRVFNLLGLVFVTKLRKNAIVTVESDSRSVSSFGGQGRHYYAALQAYARRFPVTYFGNHQGQLALVTHDKHPEPGRTKYLFTNDPTLTTREIVERYRSRWTIECCFRTLKQYYGLEACQAQMMPQVLLHIRMVFLAYTLTQLLMVDPNSSVEQMQTHLRSLHCLTLPNQEPQLVCQQDNGLLVPVDLDDLFTPLRTRIPALQNFSIPSIKEMIHVT